MKTNLLRLVALVTFITCFFLVSQGNLQGAVILTFVSAATLAGHRGYLRGQLGAAPDTTDVTADLNLDEILDASIKAFSRTIIALRIFATIFRNVQLKGTDIVEVPYYPLQGINSKDFSGSYDFSTGAGSKTESRKVTVNKRKYQPLAFTSRDLARLPMLNAQQLGTMKGEKLAYDVIQDILSVVTPTNFPAVAFVGTASGFDSNDVIDIRTACGKNSQGPASVTDGVTNSTTTITSATANFGSNDIGAVITGSGIPVGAYIESVTNSTTAILSAAATATATGVTLAIGRPLTPWPLTGRGLLLNPDYDGALLKDDSFRRDLTLANQNTILTGELPNVYGFQYATSAAIPGNGVNLVGMATYMSAILAAFSPIEPAPAVRERLTEYEIVTDADSEISLEYRVWGDADSDTEKRVIEANYGYAPGEAQAIKLLKSA